MLRAGWEIPSRREAMDWLPSARRIASFISCRAASSNVGRVGSSVNSWAEVSSRFTRSWPGWIRWPMRRRSHPADNAQFAGRHPVAGLPGNGIFGIDLIAVKDRAVDGRSDGVEDQGNFGEAGHDNFRPLGDEVLAGAADHLHHMPAEIAGLDPVRPVDGSGEILVLAPVVRVEEAVSRQVFLKKPHPPGIGRGEHSKSGSLGVSGLQMVCYCIEGVDNSRLPR